MTKLTGVLISLVMHKYATRNPKKYGNIPLFGLVKNGTIFGSYMKNRKISNSAPVRKDGKSYIANRTICDIIPKNI